MNRSLHALGALVLVLGSSACAHRPMTNPQLARSVASVGAAVIITSVIVYAEHRDADLSNRLPDTTAAALPPK